MGPTWGPPEAARTQVGPMLATWTLPSGIWWNKETICKGHHYDNHWYYEMVSNFSIVSFQVLSMKKVKGIEERHFDSLKSRARYIIHINFNFSFHCRFFMMMSSNGTIFRITGPLNRGIHHSLVNSPHKGKWRGALMFSLICAWINGWINNHEAAYLRCHCAHYDAIVMSYDKDRLWRYHSTWKFEKYIIDINFHFSFRSRFLLWQGWVGGAKRQRTGRLKRD